MGIGKQLVSVLMAVYKPDIQWLKEQLISVDNQDYPNIELLICDDCPEAYVDEKIVVECVKNIPFKIVRNDKNLGSNKTFERLTEMGSGKYFSYCDQDDVWHSDKVSRMVEVLESTGSPLVCSDLAIIDGEGKRTADSITKVRKRHIFLEGENLAESLLVRNFVSGCAMLIRADIAKKSLPFVDSLVHDHWLAINAALNGRIEVIRETLIEHREHGGNQTGVLQGVNGKSDYFKTRIENMQNRIADYKDRLFKYDRIMQTVDELEKFNEARLRYFYKHRYCDFKIMRKYRNFSKEAVMLETVMPFLPERIIKNIFKIIKIGIV